MKPALTVEWWKTRRSPVTITATALMALLLPAMGLGFYTVAVDGGTGVLAGKAGALLSEPGWVGYMGLVSQIVAVAMFLGVGVVVAWVFGREYVDRTFSSLFARPVSLLATAGAKYTVSFLWVLALGLFVTLVAIVFGWLAGVGEAGTGFWTEVARLLGVSIAAGILGLTTGYVASVGRGYLPAVGALIVIIAVSQVVVLFGTGGWFPFAVPGLLAIAGAEGAPTISVLQLALVPATAGVAIGLTLLWWKGAEVV